MSDINIEAERAAFEAHFGPKNNFAWRNADGSYKVHSLQSAWEIWLAARRTPVSAPTGAERQSIEDDDEFQDLAGDVYRAGSYNESIEKPLRALIAHIDTWAARRDAVPAHAELLAAADAVVERWHSRDWKQPHTADFINRLAAAVGAVKFRGAAPAPGNTAQTAYVPLHVLEALQKGCTVATTLTPGKDATHTEAVQLVSDNH